MFQDEPPESTPFIENLDEHPGPYNAFLSRVSRWTFGGALARDAPLVEFRSPRLERFELRVAVLFPYNYLYVHHLRMDLNRSLVLLSSYMTAALAASGSPFIGIHSLRKRLIQSDVLPHRRWHSNPILPLLSKKDTVKTLTIPQLPTRNPSGATETLWGWGGEEPFNHKPWSKLGAKGATKANLNPNPNLPMESSLHLRGE